MPRRGNRSNRRTGRPKSSDSSVFAQFQKRRCIAAETENERQRILVTWPNLSKIALSAPIERMNRRSLINGALVSAPMLLGTWAGYSRYLERHAIEVANIELQVGMPKPLTVALLGDIHFDPLF